MNEYQDQVSWYRVRCNGKAGAMSFCGDFDTRELAEDEVAFMQATNPRHAGHTHSIKRMWGQA